MFITQSKAWKIKVCFVAFLYSLSALAMDWSALRKEFNKSNFFINR